MISIIGEHYVITTSSHIRKPSLKKKQSMN